MLEETAWKELGKRFDSGKEKQNSEFVFENVLITDD